MEDKVILKAKKVKAIFTDVDGVLTDGSMYYAEGMNEHFKVFSVYDGVGVKIANLCNIPVFFVSAKRSSLLHKRASELKVKECFDGIENKKETVLKVAEKYSFNLDEIAYIGDDLVDIQVLKIVGFPVAVKNAFDEVKKHAVYITERKGGEGALREVIEYIVKARGEWKTVLDYFGGF
ncbi:3-deoxy-D-manno-octulosonate 8-phosphate phosphatase [Thermotomaculum hydrothermale]|uniref:3-deoxy-D-manno-octulosonate 8-phosphate phosphatase n=1 Tax=Thermotomaculum hydrothermale TaxID=981385 RepID=A0A7R6PF44_9BACT|nr:HAD hydrolase family protein [Thermotomaculum hydrothermale]BBB32569.1 3-deoxy-D-manno-octulosonate 8-phosphate phosphatase [Thermotomaculum hydrothermale]